MGLNAQIVTPLEPEPDLSAGLRGSLIAKTWKQPKGPLTDQWIKKMWYIHTMEYSVQFSSVAQSCPTLCDPMDYSTPGLPVHHQLPEFIQTHAH